MALDKVLIGARVRKIIEKDGTKEDIESAKTLVKKLKGKSI